MSFVEIKKCRVCGNTNLVPILNLGRQALTGVFPRKGEKIESSPVILVKCHGEGACGLVQIKHTVAPETMYGDNYGYRSGLNRSMVEHLTELARFSLDLVKIKTGDLVLDIGSNDGTLLGVYQNMQKKKLRLVGMDPTAKKFKAFYKQDIVAIDSFFGAKAFYNYFGNSLKQKAKIVTSIACFYDLEDPVAFAKDIKKILHPEGVWILEQSYTLFMLAKNMYDTTVQEHLEYYSLAVISRILKEAGLSIRRVELNDCNGGSFRVVAGHFQKGPEHASVKLLENAEKILGLEELSIYNNFESFAKLHKKNFRNLLKKIKSKGEKVYGLGASTKFNAVLQYCRVNTSLLPKIGEVNPDKFGRVTPGTNIPIVSEDEVFEGKPNYLVVGPYHFKEFFLKMPKVKKYLAQGGKLIFPLPALEIVSK